MLLRTIAALSLIGLGVALAVPAVAQSRTAPDGTPSGLQPRGGGPPSPQTLVCQSAFDTRIISQNRPSTTTSTSFVPLPGASASFTIFGDACVRIVFTAETGCSQTSAQDFCYVRALDNGVPIQPNGAGRQAIDSESGPAKGHAYQWATFIDIVKGEEQHEFTIEWRVKDRPTQFYIDDWTMSAEVYPETD